MNIVSKLGSLSVGALVTTMLCASPVSAATDGNAPTYNTTINESASSSSSNADVNVTSVNGFSLSAAQKNQVVAFVNAQGMPDSEQAKAKSITLKKGMTLKTSYVNIHGQEVWHMKFYGKGYTFYLGSDGFYHDPKCNNKVIVKQSKKRPAKGHIFIKGKIKVVKKFKFTGAASASLHELAVASSTSKSIGYVLDYTGAIVYDKNGNALINCESGAVGGGRAEVSASGSASIKGKVFYTYKAAYEALLQGAANSLELDLRNKGYSKLTVKGEVRATAKGSAESSASAFTWCRDSQLPPPPPPVEETPGPDLQSITLVNFVYVGHQISLNLSGTVAQGQTAELFCKALNGGTVTSATRRQNVPSGSFDRSIDYVAPGEIPDVLTDSSGNVIVPAGHDMVECSITQANGKSDTIRTEVGPGKFDIRQIPPQSE